jgi:hypothetical protein
LNFCIEALHLSEQVSLLDGFPFIKVLHRSVTNNVLVVHKHSDRIYSTHLKAIRGRFFTDVNLLSNENREEIFELVMNSNGLRLRRNYLSTRAEAMAIRNCTLRMIEATPSGICAIRDPDNRAELNRLTDEENFYRKYERWLIGFNWKRLLDLY